jgi:hypothetical protein
MYARELGPEGVAALGRATGLTRLQVSYHVRGAGVVPGEVGIALSRMSRLCALVLRSGEVPAPSCMKAISLLTDLTSLSWNGQHVTNADVQAWLGLKKLRSLRIEPQSAAPSESDRITADTFFALAGLPELRILSMREKFGSHPFDLTDEVRTLVNAERHKKGWPSLELFLKDFYHISESGARIFSPAVVVWELDHKFMA